MDVEPSIERGERTEDVAPLRREDVGDERAHQELVGRDPALRRASAVSMFSISRMLSVELRT